MEKLSRTEYIKKQIAKDILDFDSCEYHKCDGCRIERLRNECFNDPYMPCFKIFRVLAGELAELTIRRSDLVAQNQT